MTNTIKEFSNAGNPFLDDSKDLINLETKTIMTEDVVKSVYMAETVGQEQYRAFVDSRLCTNKQKISDTISKNNLPLFNSVNKKPANSSKQNLTTMKSNVNLFSRMYISCQTRGGDLDSFFHMGKPTLAPLYSRD